MKRRKAAAKPPTGMPRLVSLRFLAVCLGMTYASTVVTLRRAGVPARDGMRSWREVKAAVGSRFINSGTIAKFAKAVDPQSQTSTPFVVSPELEAEIHKAWLAKGVSVKEGLIRSRTDSSGGEEKPTEGSDDLAKQADQQFRYQQARAVGAEEQARWRRLQSRRMAGMMCDRQTMQAEAAVAGRIVGRFLLGMPARMAGYMQQHTAMTDAEIRAVEQSLDREVPGLLSELNKQLEQAERQAAAVASSQRYGRLMGGEEMLQ
jgi:hypothetical protein